MLVRLHCLAQLGDNILDWIESKVAMKCEAQSLYAPATTDARDDGPQIFSENNFAKRFETKLNVMLTIQNAFSRISQLLAINSRRTAIFIGFDKQNGEAFSNS